MGWTNSHLYELRAGDVWWSTPYPDADWGVGEFLDAGKAQLTDILEDVGIKKLTYLYDFGDGWEHTIKVERLIDPEPGVLYRRLIEVSGRCPPEDWAALGPTPNCSNPSRTLRAKATPNLPNGSATTSIPTQTRPNGSSLKSMLSPKMVAQAGCKAHQTALTRGLHRRVTGRRYQFALLKARGSTIFVPSRDRFAGLAPRCTPARRAFRRYLRRAAPPGGAVDRGLWSRPALPAYPRHVVHTLIWLGGSLDHCGTETAAARRRNKTASPGQCSEYDVDLRIAERLL
jgi:pRiA4b ORF-3-like protein